ncbi:PP2C family protein-serine/threonine phosphatase [Aestuariibacter salexigens]|uniref:PP2C family protein-serine/threonine phosphatase n=1 Tax=Aestuariibacter salexigens TaxID=226010 RepID=UPI0004149BF3|nr:protein phosphatase 2C domain-containing protein [Aestuariibacter salexigens]
MESNPSKPVQDKKQFVFESAGITHEGKVRRVNEDAMMLNDSDAHWAVADGMGGHNAGDVASQAIVAKLQKIRDEGDFVAFVDAIERGLLKVNNSLYKMASAKQEVIGSTVVGFAYCNDFVVCYWAGDSRLYALKKDGFRQLTEDHTVVQEMLDAGEITKAEAQSHPEKNVITRAVGSDKSLCVDFMMVDIEPGDVLVLCSDGVEKELTDEEFHELLCSDDDLYQSLQNIVDAALEKGGRDNITLVAVKFEAEEQ